MSNSRTYGGMFRKLGRDLLLNGLAGSPLLNSPMRIPVMRRLGMNVDPSVNIEPGCWFSSRKVSIGSGCRFNVQCFFDATAPISIGRNCNFGPQVMIHTSAHAIGDADRRCGVQIPQPVRIGDACWLGLRVSVLPGVTVGDGCVIAAGALVVSDCEPNGVYGGVPARRLRELDPTERRITQPGEGPTRAEQAVAGLAPSV